MPAPPSADLFWRVLLSLGGAALALRLDQIEDHVYLQLWPDTVGLKVSTEQSTDVQWPAVLFTLDGDSETVGVSDTGTRSWQLPVRCYVADENPGHEHRRLRTYLVARKALFDRFRERPLYPPLGRGQLGGAPMPEVCNVVVEPGLIFDPKAPQYQHVVSGMLLRIEVEEARDTDNG